MTEKLSGREGEPELPMTEVCEELQDALGQQITAYAVGERDPASIGRFSLGDTPSPEIEERLRTLYGIFKELSEVESAETIRAWMIGSQPLLEDEAPVELLHRDESGPVENAAKTFAVAV